MPTDLNRRNFLSATAAAGLVIGAGSQRAPAAHIFTGRRSRGAAKARNVIFMVADGMSIGTLTIAQFVRADRDGRNSNWVNLWNKPGVRRASCMTSSADSVVTDSSAAASSWGIGIHINNDAVNYTPDGKTPTPILAHARQYGKLTGLVTTARVTHATPSGFSANAPKRSFESGIAVQQLDRRYDVLLGGGARYFPKELLDKHPDMQVVRTQQELFKAGLDGRLLGIFAKDHVPYFIDRGRDTPSLPMMTKAALDRLERGTDGFVLQIEGGRVDHAAHDNDAAALIGEQLDFDDAIKTVLDWIGDRDDTLLIITTDHGNANPGLTVYGPEGRAGLRKLYQPKHSFEWIWKQLSEQKATSNGELAGKLLPDMIEASFGLQITSDELAQVATAFDHKRVHPSDLWMNKPLNILGSVLSNYTGVCFLSPNHTADLVEVTSMGPGSETIAPMIDNISLHGTMVDALALGEAKPVEMAEMAGPAPKPD